MRHPIIRRAGALLAASALVLAACGDDDTDAQAAGEPAEVPTTLPTEDAEPADDASEPDTTASDDAGPDTDADTVLDVVVADGEVAGGGRQKVDLGDSVTIRVTSDIADHIHLHGYDVLADVAAGETAELTFEATIPGVFEVELEDARIPLLELEIS